MAPSSLNFHIKYIKCHERYNVGHNGVIDKTINGLAMTYDLG